jgi:hypothetical protein
MEILQDTDPNENKPNHLIEDYLNKLFAEIKEAENEHLKKLYLRFCLLKGKMVDFEKLKLVDFPGRPNYGEWWYRIGYKDAYLLMTRNLIAEVIEGTPNFKLEIIPNKELDINSEY